MQGKKIAIVLFTLIALCFSGCYTTKQIRIKNDKDSNFNLNSDAVPVTIMLYQLKDTAKFKDATAMDLIERADVVLGKDKIDITKMQIAPDSEKVVATIDKNEIPYIGILVIYNNMFKKKKIKSLVESDEISRDLLELEVKKEGIFIIGRNKDEELIK